MIAKKKMLLAGAAAAVLLSSPVILQFFFAKDWVSSRWAGVLLAPSYPGLLAALEIGPLLGPLVGGLHSGDGRGFWVAVFVLNTLILWSFLVLVLNLIERFTNWKRNQI